MLGVGFLTNAMKHIKNIGGRRALSNICFDGSFSENTQLQRMDRTDRCAAATEGTLFLIPKDLPWQILYV